jgi:hypothetical protein
LTTQVVGALFLCQNETIIPGVALSAIFLVEVGNCIREADLQAEKIPTERL